MVTILHQEVFGIIRALMPFRLAGSPKDYILIGSDSGRIITMEYLPEKNTFQRIHCETYGKSGVRRVVPGQYIAVDPKGRACLIASVEKNKLVYVLNRDAQLNYTISSPLEAHKQGAIVFAVTSLDVGYENPIFAALEVDYTEVDQDPTGQQYETLPKTLVYYELDLGLNHVVRKWSDVVDRRSNFLLAVPGGADGPGGVLVGTEDWIYYKHQNRETFRVPIPKRKGIPNEEKSQARKQIIIAGVMHKMKQTFFSLVQNEDGDIFKISFPLSEDRKLTGLKVKYFDTVPTATALCILKSGYLYTPTEFGNQMVYKFEKLGDDDQEQDFLSEDFDEDAMQYGQKALFTPRPLENLSLADEIVSMNPIMGSKVVNLTGEDAPQIYTINGSGARSSFRKLVHGLDVNEMATTNSDKPVENVWTTKITTDDQYARYIVLSYMGAKESTVLSIGESVEALPDSQTGFISKVRTLAVQQMGEDLLLQVHETGMRLIRPGGHTIDWKAPTHRTIRQVATNARQVVLFLSNGELAYFEYAEGQLNEYEQRKRFDNNITCLAIAEVPEGRVRTDFLAVGADDNTVQIISLDENSTLERLSIQALSALPTSLCIVAMEDAAGQRLAQTLYLHIGLENGLYLRTILDTTDGSLSDTRRRFLGTKAVKLVQIEVQKQSCVLAMSSRSWLAYNQSAGLTLTPLSYPPLESAWRFSNGDWGVDEGIVGVEGVNLR
jgi:splicing factor 3B subunit 3